MALLLVATAGRPEKEVLPSQIKKSEHGLFGRIIAQTQRAGIPCKNDELSSNRPCTCQTRDNRHGEPKRLEERA
ncbi:MAG: hypothetical protein CBC48_16330 [bacterium TMED88]|nr:hypothetical protein [Deltaproteobacteria bacterium]OUV25527.1 MAG: hypothetical protein CBC48_16330 [bacterium TMED88]